MYKIMRYLLFWFFYSVCYGSSYYELDKLYPPITSDIYYNASLCYPVIDEDGSVYSFDTNEEMIYKYSNNGYRLSSYYIRSQLPSVSMKGSSSIDDGIVYFLGEKFVSGEEVDPIGVYALYKDGSLESYISHEDLGLNAEDIRIFRKYDGVSYLVSLSDSVYSFHEVKGNKIIKSYSVGLPEDEFVLDFRVSNGWFFFISHSSSSVEEKYARVYKLNQVGEFFQIIHKPFDSYGPFFDVLEDGEILLSSWNSPDFSISLYDSEGGSLLIDEVIYSGTGGGNASTFSCIVSMAPSTSAWGFPFVTHNSNNLIFTQSYNGIKIKANLIDDEVIVEEVKDYSQESYFTDVYYQSDRLYVADRGKNEIAIFNQDLEKIDSWVVSNPLSIRGFGDRFYVTTDSSYLSVLGSNGEWLYNLGSSGNSLGEFKSTYGLAAYNGLLYISDKTTDQISVFDGENFVFGWGSEGTGLVTLDGVSTIDNNVTVPRHMEADYDGSIYVAAGRYYLLRFSSEGVSDEDVYLRADFSTIYDIDISGGLFFVTDTGYNTNKNANLIKVFDENKVLMTTIGGRGHLANQLLHPQASEAMDNGNVLYIADTGNNRIVKYRKVDRPDTSKAIILAGGDEAGNTLWDEAQANANHAFWALANQGYTKANIHYLNHNTNLDLDGNGEPDDVDGIPSLANVRAALVEWAAEAVEGEPVEDVVLYMIGHGGDGTFELGNGEILTAEQLNTWLDELQAIMPGKVTIIYDGCQSGSFQPIVSEGSSNRTVITSAQADQNAYFQDAISFSHLFWNQVFSGKTLSEAFQATRTSIGLAFASSDGVEQQSPLIDSDGNGETNSDSDYAEVAQQAIGNGTVYAGNAPEIGHVALTPVGIGESTSTITVSEITDDQAVQSVWGIVTPPYADLTQLGTPVQNLPRFDLFKQEDGSYTGSFDGFEQPGTYQVAIYAQDQEGNTSLPYVESLHVINPLGRKALLVAGTDAQGQFSAALQKQTDHAYAALTGQGYSDASNQSCTNGDNVCYLSANSVGTPGVDQAASKDGLEHMLTSWAVDATSDLVVYLVGDVVNGTLQLSDTDSVTLTELRDWLDQAQAGIEGTLTVIHEGNNSGASVAAFGTVSDDSDRIVISSSALGQGNHLLAGGDASFSRYFWGKVAQGGDIEDAFAAGSASLAMVQTAQINANGNAFSNEKSDRYQARYHQLGLGILLAANEPEIGRISLNIELSDSNQETLWVEQITSLSPVSKVWAVIEPPEYDPITKQTGGLIEIPLTDGGQDRWSVDYSGFDRSGVYTVHYYAQDSAGRISAPRTHYITQTQGVDAYETDNTSAEASYLSAITDYHQWHNFSNTEDIDYIAFDADPARGSYTLKVDSTASSADAAFQLYNSDNTPIALGLAGSPQEYVIDAVFENSVELAYWTPPVAGRYLLKVTQAGTATSATFSDGYTVSAYPTDAPNDGSISGIIRNEAGSPVVGARVHTDENQQAITNQDGWYAFAASLGDRTVTVTASGYNSTEQQLHIDDGDAAELDIDLSLLESDQNADPDTINTDDELPVIQALKPLITDYPAEHQGLIVMQALRLNIPEGGATLHNLTLNGHGESNEATDVSAVKLYHDLNQNQQIDSSDIQIGDIYTFDSDNGSINVSLLEPYQFPIGQQQVVVGYELD